VDCDAAQWTEMLGVGEECVVGCVFLDCPFEQRWKRRVGSKISGVVKKGGATPGRKIDKLFPIRLWIAAWRREGIARERGRQ
jgi:hypothetical protein